VIPRRLDSVLPQSRWSIAVLLALATAVGVASCRKHLPRPADGIVTGGSAGSGAGGSNGGAGGNVVDMAPVPDVATPDMREAGAETPPACGLPGQPCCPGNECKSGGCCEADKCTGSGDPCTLYEGAACFNAQCGGYCGEPKVPPAIGECCLQRNCTKPFSICDATPGKGVCVNCGGVGEPCCSKSFCKPGGTCANMLCAPAASVSPPF
jgi:hypothetical protein